MQCRHFGTFQVYLVQCLVSDTGIRATEDPGVEELGGVPSAWGDMYTYIYIYIYIHVYIYIYIYIYRERGRERERERESSPLRSSGSARV